MLPNGDGPEHGPTKWRQFTTLEKAIKAYLDCNWILNEGTYVYQWVEYKPENNRTTLKTYQFKKCSHGCGSIVTFIQLSSTGVILTCPKCGSTRSTGPDENTLITEKIVPLREALAIMKKTGQQPIPGMPQSIIPDNKKSIYDGV